mmetsp:Transcript_16284/g.53218  ORF Transcript_16284/g.53218 Transcript_16284/m.53218 type:complete len:339 (+) Transcript_16284:3901-4917(+)
MKIVIISLLSRRARVFRSRIRAVLVRSRLWPGLGRGWFGREAHKLQLAEHLHRARVIDAGGVVRALRHPLVELRKLGHQLHLVPELFHVLRQPLELLARRLPRRAQQLHHRRRARVQALLLRHVSKGGGQDCVRVVPAPSRPQQRLLEQADHLAVRESPGRRSGEDRLERLLPARSLVRDRRALLPVAGTAHVTRDPHVPVPVARVRLRKLRRVALARLLALGSKLSAVRLAPRVGVAALRTRCGHHELRARHRVQSRLVHRERRQDVSVHFAEAVRKCFAARAERVHRRIPLIAASAIGRPHWARTREVTGVGADERRERRQEDRERDRHTHPCPIA